MNNDRRQRVQHVLYEGEVQVWTEEPDDGGPHQIILRDTGPDHGNDLGEWLAWLFGPGRAEGKQRCRMAKRLRILVDDLEPQDGAGERRIVEGDPLNMEQVALIKGTSESYRQASSEVLAATTRQWQQLYRQSIAKLRAVFMTAAAYELLVAQAKRKKDRS